MSGREARALQDRLAESLRGFGPVSILVLLILLLVGPAWFRAILVLIWAKVSGTPFVEIGYVCPRSWSLTLTLGVVLGVAFKLMMKALIMPILGAPAINQTYHYLAG